MRIVFRAAGVAAIALCATGCATITRTKHTAFEVKTKPPGASVKTTNGFSCDATPCSLTILRNAEFDTTIAKPGYKSLTIHVTHKVSGGGGAGMAGNVLVGGLIGVAVDASSGAMYDLTPNPIDVELEAETNPTAAPVVAPPAAKPVEPAAQAPAPAAPAADASKKPTL